MRTMPSAAHSSAESGWNGRMSEYLATALDQCRPFDALSRCRAAALTLRQCMAQRCQRG